VLVQRKAGDVVRREDARIVRGRGQQQRAVGAGVAVGVAGVVDEGAALQRLEHPRPRGVGAGEDLRAVHGRDLLRLVAAPRERRPPHRGGIGDGDRRREPLGAFRRLRRGRRVADRVALHEIPPAVEQRGEREGLQLPVRDEHQLVDARQLRLHRRDEDAVQRGRLPAELFLGAPRADVFRERGHALGELAPPDAHRDGRQSLAREAEDRHAMAEEHVFDERRPLGDGRGP
jgi:hypothetical protein